MHVLAALGPKDAGLCISQDCAANREWSEQPNSEAVEFLSCRAESETNEGVRQSERPDGTEAEALGSARSRRGDEAASQAAQTRQTFGSLTVLGAVGLATRQSSQEAAAVFSKWCAEHSARSHAI